MTEHDPWHFEILHTAPVGSWRKCYRWVLRRSNTLNFDPWQRRPLGSPPQPLPDRGEFDLDSGFEPRQRRRGRRRT